MSTELRLGRRNRYRVFAASFALVVASLWTACGGAKPAPTEPDVRTVLAPGEAAHEYSTRLTSRSGRELGADARSGKAAVEKGILAAATLKEVALEGDGRLDQLAEWTARELGEGATPPPHEVLEFFSRHLGLVEPVPHLLILGNPDANALTNGIRDSVVEFLERQLYNRYGVAVVQRDGLSIAVVMLTARHVELEPIPRKVALSDRVELQGRLSDDYRNPTLAIAQPDGTVERTPAGTGPAFQVRMPFQKTGVHRVELLAKGPRGDAVLANFPLFVGVEAPQQVVVKSRKTDEGGFRASTVRDDLIRLLNETRTQANLLPLTHDDRLADVARLHSQDMVDSGFIGHNSPTTGGAAERVARSGIRTGLVLENIGRGYSAREIHEGLLESPGHRANVLNPDVTHLGIGVVGERESNRTAYVATEVFVRMISEIDVDAAPEELLEMINAGREARGARPLEADKNLTKAASKAATDYFANKDLSQQDAVDAASFQMRRFAIAYKRIGGLMTVVGNLREAAKLEPTFDPAVRYVGIGVAQGSRPDAPPNSIAVVVMLGWPR